MYIFGKVLFGIFTFIISLPYLILLLPLAAIVLRNRGYEFTRRFLITQGASFYFYFCIIFLPLSIGVFFYSGFEYWKAYGAIYFLVGAVALFSPKSYEKILHPSSDHWLQTVSIGPLVPIVSFPYMILILPFIIKFSKTWGGDAMQRYQMVQGMSFFRHFCILFLPLALGIFIYSGFEYWSLYIAAYLLTGIISFFRSKAHERIHDLTVDQWTQPINFTCESCGYSFWKIGEIVYVDKETFKEDYYLIQCARCEYTKKYSPAEYFSLRDGWTYD